MRVLLIEDTERLRELTAAALRKSGFAVDAFGTIGEAEQALDMVAYDGVLLDIGLPDGDGMSFLAALRRDGRSVPVMLLTARDDVASVVDGLRLVQSAALHSVLAQTSHPLDRLPNGSML